MKRRFTFFTSCITLILKIAMRDKFVSNVTLRHTYILKVSHVYRHPFVTDIRVRNVLALGFLLRASKDTAKDTVPESQTLLSLSPVTRYPHPNRQLRNKWFLLPTLCV